MYEYKEVSKFRSKRVLFAIVFVLVVALAGSAIAASYLRSNDYGPVVINPSPSPTPIAVQLSGDLLTTQSYINGQSLTLTATLADGANGKTVGFFDQNNLEVGSAVSANGGVAVLVFVPAVGSWTYHAIVQ
jgi:hypothetical protein